MSIINVGLSFLYSLMKEKSEGLRQILTLKSEFALILTFKTKRNQTYNFPYTQSWSLGQAYSSLNSAKFSLLSELMLLHVLHYLMDENNTYIDLHPGYNAGVHLTQCIFYNTCAQWLQSFYVEISGKKTFMLLHCYDIFLQQAIIA